MEFETSPFSKNGNLSLNTERHLQYGNTSIFLCTEEYRSGGRGCEGIFIPRSSETKGCTLFERVLFGELLRKNREQVTHESNLFFFSSSTGTCESESNTSVLTKQIQAPLSVGTLMRTGKLGKKLTGRIVNVYDNAVFWIHVTRHGSNFANNYTRGSRSTIYATV
jgi:hypothetical protein